MVSYILWKEPIIIIEVEKWKIKNKKTTKNQRKNII
jgi:hypothetical protein